MCAVLRVPIFCNSVLEHLLFVCVVVVVVVVVIVSDTFSSAVGRRLYDLYLEPISIPYCQ
jgi:hypothetical protein